MNTTDSHKDETKSEAKCRLCGRSVELMFNKKIMHKYSTTYYRCCSCGCLQTQVPYWLKEAYRDPVRYTDTFAAQRCGRMSRLIFIITKILRLSVSLKVLDWGGGDGLLTRMLRDLGIDAYSFDMYSKNTYAGGFDRMPNHNYDFITAFEVLEHMAYPREELGEIFGLEPRFILFSTCLYEGQDSEWPYLAPYSGRHIHFFTRKAMEGIATRYGYSVIMNNNLFFYYKRRLQPIVKQAITFLMSERGYRLAQIAVPFVPTRCLTDSDYQLMLEHVGETPFDS